MKVNQGFAASPGGRRVSYDSKDRYNDVGCGSCGEIVPDGEAHIVANYRYGGGHQLFCPDCCPCGRQPESVRPLNGNAHAS